MKTGRNDPCPCGSGKKFKNCCLGKIAQKALESLPGNSNIIPKNIPEHELIDFRTLRNPQFSLCSDCGTLTLRTESKGNYEYFQVARMGLIRLDKTDSHNFLPPEIPKLLT